MAIIYQTLRRKSMFYDADLYTDDMETKLMKRPVCCYCKEHIQDDDCIETPDGELVCGECEMEHASELWFDFARHDYVRRTDK